MVEMEPAPGDTGNPALQSNNFFVFFFISCHWLKSWTCKYDRVQWIRTPKFNKMHSITETKTWMTAKHNARLTKIGAESFRINVLEMLQSGVLYKTLRWFNYTNYAMHIVVVKILSKIYLREGMVRPECKPCFASQSSTIPPECLNRPESCRPPVKWKTSEFARVHDCPDWWKDIRIDRRRHRMDNTESKRNHHFSMSWLCTESVQLNKNGLPLSMLPIKTYQRSCIVRPTCCLDCNVELA